MASPIIDKRFAQIRWNVTLKVARSIEYIAIHYTGTDASALNNVKYFSTGNRGASADFFVDKDGSIFQFNANIANYYTWHCGDGKGKYGISNANSIGIEVVSSGAEFTDAQKKALRELVPWLMEQHGVKPANVVRHYDASRKACPAPYCGSDAKDARWRDLHAFITEEEEDMAIEYDKLAKAVWGYQNERLEQVDAYQILRDIRDEGPRETWRFKNEKLEAVDAYQILRDIRDSLKSVEERLDKLEQSAKL